MDPFMLNYKWNLEDMPLAPPYLLLLPFLSSSTSQSSFSSSTSQAMSLVYTSGGSLLCNRPQNTHMPKASPFPKTRLIYLLLLPSSSSLPSPRQTAHIVHARKGITSRTSRRLENRGKKGNLNTKPEKDEESGGIGGTGQGETEDVVDSDGIVMGYMEGSPEGTLTPMPKLEGLERALLEGPQFDALGFVFQYLWAFGIVFALVACGIAVTTYNEGATDFKQTPVYKESIQSRGLLEEPEASTSDIFEGNPTEVAPNLD